MCRPRRRRRKDDERWTEYLFDCLRTTRHILHAMETDLEQLARDLEKLPVSSRSYLAERLIEGLEPAAVPEVETPWLNEAGRRWNEINSGKVSTIPIAVTMQEAYRSLKR